MVNLSDYGLRSNQFFQESSGIQPLTTGITEVVDEFCLREAPSLRREVMTGASGQNVVIIYYHF